MTTDELLQRWSAGSITADELRELTAKLAEPQHQSALLDDWLLESCLPDRLPGAAVAGLRESEMSRSVERVDSPRGMRWTRWLQWRPLAAAAAGLVFGLLSASMVFAYAVPRMKLDKPRVVPLFTESFEDAKLVSGRGFPSHAGGWSGDLAAVIPTELGVNPKEGKYMARLAPNAERKFCIAARIVDLAEYPLPVGAASQTVEVTASFHRIASDLAERNQIRLAAFSEAPHDVKSIWSSDHMFDQVLQHVARTVTTKHGENGWQTLKATMGIPPGARSLVIYLGAAVPDDSAPKTVHFLDDVHAQFVIKEANP